MTKAKSEKHIVLVQVANDEVVVVVFEVGSGGVMVRSFVIEENMAAAWGVFDLGPATL